MDQLRERLAGHELHDDEQAIAVLFDGMNGGDVGVIELRGGARLALHPGDRFGVRGDRRRQDLDGHRAAEAGVLRLPHLSHPAGADARIEAVDAEMLSRLKHAGHIAGQRVIGLGQITESKYVMARSEFAML